MVGAGLEGTIIRPSSKLQALLWHALWAAIEGRATVASACVLSRSAQVVRQSFQSRNLVQNPLGKGRSSTFARCHVLFSCAGLVSKFSTWRFSAPGWGQEKALRDSCLEKIAGRAAGGHMRKIRHQHAHKRMNITGEQMKFLSQLGEFLDNEMWVAGCDWEEFEAAISLLKRAGSDGLFVQFVE